MADNGKVIGINELRCNSGGDDTNNDYLREGKASVNDDAEYSEEELEGTQCVRKTDIYDLPRQVWLDIYEHIDYPTYLNLRRVSHHFLHLINEYIGIRVNFFGASMQDPDMFNFFTGIALNDVQFEDARDPEKYNFGRIFKYPGFLTDVSFTGETNLKLLQDILLYCPCLKLVEMTMDCKLVRMGGEIPGKTNMIFPEIDIQSLVPPSKSYLKYVECLKLVPGVHNDDNLRSHMALSILRGTHSGDNLRKVIFQCELSEDITLTNVLNITAELLERHPKIEALFMALLNDEYLLASEDNRKTAPFMDLESSVSNINYHQEQLDYFQKRMEATGKYLRIKKIGLAMLNSSMQTIWGTFLRTQHHLVHLSLTVTIEDGTFSQELFDSCSGTLEQLAIRGKFEVPFDFEYISNCRSLKEICLHNLQENGGGGLIPKCINLPQVADGLESLILFQVVARTEEIKETVAKLEKLHTLVVFKCGHAAGETGIGLECLQQIIHKRSLQSILMVQFICGSTSEAEAVAGILYDMSRYAANQANAERNRVDQQREFPQDQVEHVLNLPLVEDGGDVLMFPLAGGNNDIGRGPEVEVEAPPVNRPVSRGSHRDLDPVLDEEACIEHAEAEPVEHSTPPSTSKVEVTDVTQSEIGNSGGNSTKFSLTSEEFPPLLETANTSSSEAPLVAVQDQEPEEEDADDNGLEVEEIRINLIMNPDDGNNIPLNQNHPLNMLHNILEQALGNQAQGHDHPNHHPHLRNHMNLNQLQQDMDGDMELILDVGEDLGPVLDLFAAEQLAREHNVQVGFILDGVIDIMNEDVVRSKWLCVEDDEGHITYTLKISVEL